jgi:hypothetical protein
MLEAQSFILSTLIIPLKTNEQERTSGLYHLHRQQEGWADLRNGCMDNETSLVRDYRICFILGSIGSKELCL